MGLGKVSIKSEVLLLTLSLYSYFSYSLPLCSTLRPSYTVGPFRETPVPRHHPHHPDTSPLPPRRAPLYPPHMEHPRNADGPIAITISFVADTSASMPWSGSDGNSRGLLHLGEKITGIVATLCHTPYESITKTTSPQLRRPVKQPPAAITTSFVANAFQGQDVVRLGQRQGGLVSPICKNTSPHSYGSAQDESPSALGYNG